MIACVGTRWALSIGLLLLLPLDGAHAHVRYELPRPGPDLELATRYEAEGSAALAAGDVEGACLAWERALTAAAGPEGLVLRARVRFDLAGVLRRSGELDRALAHYEQARSGFVQLGDRLHAARALHNAGIASMDRGDAERALAAYEAALEEFVDLGAEGDVSIAANSVALLLAAQGRFSGAEVWLEHALAHAVARGDATDRMFSLVNLGHTWTGMGKLGAARRALEEAAALARELDVPWVAATVRMDLSVLDFHAGRYASALDHGERAVREWGALRNEPKAAQALSNLGAIHLSLGDLGAARACVERALEKAEAGHDRAVLASTLGTLGYLHQALGDRDEALACTDRRLALWRALGDRSGVAGALGDRGSLLLEEGRLAEAEDAYRRSLEGFATLGARLAEARTLNNLALVRRQRGGVEEAIRLHERALAIAVEVGAPEPEARMRWGLAIALEARGRVQSALDQLRRAVAAAARTGAGLEEEEGSRARETWLDLFHAGVAMAVRAKRPKDVFFFLESGRAGVLLEALGAREALRTALIPQAARVAEAAASRRHDAAVAALRRAEAGDDLDALEAARAALTSARDRLEEVAASARRGAKAGAELLHPTPVELAAAQSWLAADEALVLYGLTPEHAVALVVTRRSARIVRLESTSAIESGCEKLILDDPALDPTDALAALRRGIAKPLGLSKRVKRVYVSPHGALAQVPLALLLPDQEVVYVPSATTLGRLRGEETQRGGRVLALGDPDYRAPRDDRSLALLRSGAALPPLPGSRAEAEAIGDVVLLGREATERGLAAQLASGDRWRAVHLTCHGLIDPERPLFSSLALTPEDGDDGLLTVLEVFRMDVPADLVALSACETARGKEYRAEGILGLTHAFLCAGTPRVLCSLWEVDDAATKALMTRFYELWRPAGGLDAATALRQAQAEVRAREGWSHPHYWAAWVLWGLPDG